MSIQGSLARHGDMLRNRFLELDNNIIGLLIGVLATFDWIILFSDIHQIRFYFSLGVYGLKLLSMLTVLASAIYLTFAAMILVSSRRPVSRYKSVLPNLTAILAAFAVYLFALAPRGSVLGVSVYVALSLIFAGTVLVIVSMFFLRRAFSITPQARFLVTSGPYRFVRHPMYVGNILSLFGLAILVDSWEAMLLFFICGSLQIARAYYDENVLEGAFPAYADYRKNVGSFLPRIFASASAATAVFILATLCFWAPRDAAAVTPPTSMISTFKTLAVPKSLIILAANPTDEWGPKCEAWSSMLARPGVWFSASQKATIDSAQNTLRSIDKCKSFAALWSKCRSYENDLANKNVSDAAFIKEIGDLSGCQAIVGLDSVCTALETTAYGGAILTPPQLDVIAECFAADLKKNPVLMMTAIRPAM